MAAKINLTRGMVALVDDHDAPEVRGYAWVAKPADQTAKIWYAYTQVKKRTIYLHRFILEAQTGILVDHINGNGLDCRRENMRLCSPSLNSANSRRHAPASGFRGVYLHKRAFSARIWINGKSRRVGSFQCPAEAALAYDAAALEAFGEFAVLNFPVGERIL